jgi:hypothetical protein
VWPKPYPDTTTISHHLQSWFAVEDGAGIQVGFEAGGSSANADADGEGGAATRN